jgi:hypothetical protein
MKNNSKQQQPSASNQQPDIIEQQQPIVIIGGTHKVGLDVGFGVTKALMLGRNPVLFPSVIGHARQIKFRAEKLKVRYPGDQIFDDAGTWFVGNLALSQLTPGEVLRLRGRTADNDALGNEFRARMMVAAIGKLFAGVTDGQVVHVAVSTGLPVDHMPQASTLKTALLGTHRVKTDQADFILNVTSCACMPQPYGTLYSQLLTTNGAINVCHTATRTGVLDVGTYTTDVALDDDGEYIDALSGSVEMGISYAQERIAAVLEGEYNQKIPHKIIAQTLQTKCFTAFGKPVDFSAEVDSALEPLLSATENLLSEKWQTGASIDVIYVSGGGAPLVNGLVSQMYPQAQLVNNSHLANAQGYLNYALAEQSQTGITQ